MTEPPTLRRLVVYMKEPLVDIISKYNWISAPESRVRMRNYPHKSFVLAQYAMRGYIKLERDGVGLAGQTPQRPGPVTGNPGQAVAARSGSSARRSQRSPAAVDSGRRNHYARTRSRWPCHPSLG